MAPDLYLSDDKRTNGACDLDLGLSTMACYPFPYLPTLQNGPSTWFVPVLDETIKHKRLKQTQEADDSIGCNPSFNSGGSGSNDRLNSLPRLQFRDHIWAYTQRYLAVEAMEEAAAALIEGEGNDHKEEASGDGMKLVQQLIACAEAVACRDKSHASAILSQLKANVIVYGTSFQRVASCFVQGLSDRLVLVKPLGAVGVVGPSVKSVEVTSEKEEALRLVYEICPQIQFGHFVANASILEALEGESSVHVLDLGMTLGLPLGHQWRNLMDSLANRAGQPPFSLRVTGVGKCLERLQAIGTELEIYAQNVEIDFKFSGRKQLGKPETRRYQGT